jgi:hypothetical protein
MDAHLAVTGTLNDRNELADAIATFGAPGGGHSGQPRLPRLPGPAPAREGQAAAALDDWDDVFATVREAGKLIDHIPQPALRYLVDAVVARWHLETGQDARLRN